VVFERDVEHVADLLSLRRTGDHDSQRDTPMVLDMVALRCAQRPARRTSISGM
jgi:hypothetical protein